MNYEMGYRQKIPVQVVQPCFLIGMEQFIYVFVSIDTLGFADGQVRKVREKSIKIDISLIYVSSCHKIYCQICSDSGKNISPLEL